MVLVFILFLLAGCSGGENGMERGMELRSRLLQAQNCTFAVDIIADYGDKLHTFSMDCSMDPKGDVSFTVTKPDTLSGISGKLSGKGGKLTFDDTALYFELLTDDQISPIAAPWILIKTLRSGYIAAVSQENNQIMLSIDDSFEEDALRLDIWLDPELMPERAEILYDGKRILSVAVENFVIL